MSAASEVWPSGPLSSPPWCPECGQEEIVAMAVPGRWLCEECDVYIELEPQQPTGQATQGPAGGTARPSPGQTGS